MTNTVQIPNDQMIFSVQELKDKGFSYYKINQMVDKGILIKLNKKYYENVNFEGEESDFYYAYAFVPGGVVCLLSAAVYYKDHLEHWEEETTLSRLIEQRMVHIIWSFIQEAGI